MKTFFTCIAVSLLIFGVGTAFAQGTTLELFPGDITSAPSYTAAIPVTSAQYSFTNIPNIGTGGGSSVAFPPLTITKQLDGSTAPLQRSLFIGSHYQYIRLNFYRADGSLGYRVVFGTAFTSGYSASGAEGCTSGCPALSETITFIYGQVATYDPTTGRITTWDQLRNVERVSTIPTSAITQ